MRLLNLMIVASLAFPSFYASPVAADDSKDDAQVICKYRQQTGTRFRTKICKTAAEWEAIAEEHRNGLKQMVDRPQIKVCGPNGCD